MNRTELVAWTAELYRFHHLYNEQYLNGALRPPVIRIVEGLGTIALDHRCSVAELAIAWTLRHEAVTSAIVGVRRVEQVGGLLGASQVELGAGALTAIEELLDPKR